MFPNLDDPAPVTPTEAHRHTVDGAVVRHRRQRRTALGAVAAAFVVAAIAVGLVAGRAATNNATAGRPAKTWSAFCAIADQYKQRSEHPVIDPIHHDVIPVDPAQYPLLIAAAPTTQMADALAAVQGPLLNPISASNEHLPPEQQSALFTVNATMTDQCGFGTAVFGLVPTTN